MEAIEVARFASERAFDLLVLDEAVSGIHAGGNVSGSSRHLRRRPSSLRPRRAPCSSRKQREGSTGVCEESLEDSAKKRRARRRQRTLLNSRCITFAAPDRSSNVCSWLETHLWHAKRMHMETLWGVSLPVHSQRGCRSLAEAVKRHAIVEDWSYFRTLELRGVEADLRAVLALLCDPSVPPFERAECINGTKSSCMIIHHPGKFPQDCVGPVHFLWKADTELESGRLLWLWMHPSIFAEACGVLTSALDICECYETVSFAPTPLVRLKLRGRQARSITYRVLVPKYSGEAPDLVCTKRKEPLRNVTRDMKQGDVISLDVVDPRELYFTPQGGTKLSQNALAALEKWASSETSSGGCNQKVWDGSARSQATVAISKGRPDHKLNRERFERRLACEGFMEVAGDEFPSPAAPSTLPLCLPIMLVCHDGSSCAEKGWDIIAPPGWAMPLWRALIFAGARAISQSDIAALALDGRKPLFPQDFPETRAGKEYWEGRSLEKGSLLDGVVARLPHHAVAFGPSGLKSPVLALPTNVCVAITMFSGVPAKCALIGLATADIYKLWKAHTHKPSPESAPLSALKEMPQPMGMVTSGGYSMSAGYGVAVGLCEAGAVRESFEIAQQNGFVFQNSFLVLVRNDRGAALKLGRASLLPDLQI